MIPKDPIMLLSYINTQLRDYTDSLETLCSQQEIDQNELIEKMNRIGYHYVRETNQFVSTD